MKDVALSGGDRPPGRARRRLGGPALLAAVIALLALAGPANAAHLFPLLPNFDPAGHDCAKALSENPGNSARKPMIVGTQFVDNKTLTSTTKITAGQSVTWMWTTDHCHSVTFSPTMGTVGAPGFIPAQPELVRYGGKGKKTFTQSFPEAGTFNYFCVHHASIGMTGKVVVKPG